jgi:hypothetical protein
MQHAVRKSLIIKADEIFDSVGIALHGERFTTGLSRQELGQNAVEKIRNETFSRESPL